MTPALHYVLRALKPEPGAPRIPLDLPAPARPRRSPWSLLAGLVTAIVVAALALAAAANAQAATRTFNVNPATGKNSNSGSATSPLKTLTKALSKARAGDTIQLAGGNYSQATGERFSSVNGTPTVVVPSGVTIHGNTGAGLRTILFGAPNQVALALAGSATINEVTTVGFGDGLEASQGAQILDGMHFTGGGIRLSGSANTTLTGQVHLDPSFRVDNGQTIFTGPAGAAISVNDQAQFTMTGGDLFSSTSLGDGVPNCDITQKGIFTSGSAHVTLNSVLHDANRADHGSPAYGACDRFRASRARTRWLTGHP